jgi:hypothetical protein
VFAEFAQLIFDVLRAAALFGLESSSSMPAFSAEFSPATLRKRLFCRSPLAWMLAIAT